MRACVHACVGALAVVLGITRLLAEGRSSLIKSGEVVSITITLVSNLIIEWPVYPHAGGSGAQYPLKSGMIGINPSPELPREDKKRGLERST